MSYDIPFTGFKLKVRAIGPELMAAIQEVLESGIYILGPKVQEFEKVFASLCGVNHGVGLGSGTCSLHMALRGFGIGKGDEVITAANSFFASAGAIGVTGATPVFADVCEDLNLDPSAVEAAITPRTRALMPVHLTGRPADMTRMVQIAERHNLPIVEDASQAAGARWKGKPVGGFGKAACFSLHPLKTIHAFGDAGVVVTDDVSLAEYLKRARNHGLRNREECDFWSFNSRLDELHAAVLLLMMNHYEKWIERRRLLAGRYREGLGDCVGVPSERPEEYHVYHSFMIQADRRDELQAYLQGKGVEALVHYPVILPDQEAASASSSRLGDYPIARKLAGRVLSLPLYPELEEAQQDRVIELIRQFYK